MSNQILVPSLGESVTEATVSKWLKQVGEEVNSDEPLVELETDKVNIEVPSPLSGTLSSIKVKEGDTVEVGALLGLVNKGKSSSNSPQEKELPIQKEQMSTKDVELQKISPSIQKIRPSKKKIVKKKEPPNLQEPLNLNEQVQTENQPLVLETLAEQEQ